MAKWGHSKMGQSAEWHCGWVGREKRSRVVVFKPRPFHWGSKFTVCKNSFLCITLAFCCLLLSHDKWMKFDALLGQLNWKARIRRIRSGGSVVEALYRLQLPLLLHARLAEQNRGPHFSHENPHLNPISHFSGPNSIPIPISHFSFLTSHFQLLGSHFM